MVGGDRFALGEARAEFRQQKTASHSIETETVGVIVVHGIGEQQKGDHLDSVVRPIANALSRSGRIVKIELSDDAIMAAPMFV